MIRVRLEDPVEGSSARKCGLCQFSTGSTSELDHHVEVSHSGKVVQKGDQFHIEIPLHKCQKCRFVTRDASTLEEHERKFHSGEHAPVKWSVLGQLGSTSRPHVTTACPVPEYAETDDMVMKTLGTLLPIPLNEPQNSTPEEHESKDHSGKQASVKIIKILGQLSRPQVTKTDESQNLILEEHERKDHTGKHTPVKWSVLGQLGSVSRPQVTTSQNSGPLWKYFTHHVPNKEALCMACDSVFPCGDGSTTAMTNHLKYTHNIALEEPKKEVPEAASLALPVQEKVPDMLLECDMCDFSTEVDDLMESHSNDHKCCKRCDFVGADMLGLREHMLATHRDKGALLPQAVNLGQLLRKI